MSKRTAKQPGSSGIKRVIFGTGGNGPNAQDLQQQIALRAYELYLERGAVDGRAEDDWFRAEREVRGQ
ncbi:conserved protein of unknown function [Nitrospira japonica]|uniref:DUF2934 domain-containing protein n=1 Tax=Nitrospira japonica TaxID=1325564 RepID=A0A1W1I2J6_9BACT|nr:DUF2934 domain-containing protein [Nitrospira japonica]SLM47212.1 conserved protein of unknown function [Nitrospira japonica]